MFLIEKCWHKPISWLKLNFQPYLRFYFLANIPDPNILFRIIFAIAEVTRRKNSRWGKKIFGDS